MPSLETAHLTSTIVVWSHNRGDYDEFGKPVVQPPIELKCRWIDTQEETLDSEGNPLRLVAKVQVSRAVELESTVYHGTLVEYTNLLLTSNPVTYRVATYKSVPDVKGRNSFRLLGLERLSDALPNT